MIAVRMRTAPDVPGYNSHLHTFDPSRRSGSSLPLWDGDGGGTERTASLWKNRKDETGR